MICMREGSVRQVTRRTRNGVVGRQNRIVKKQSSQFFFFGGRMIVLFVIDFLGPNYFSFRWKGKANRKDKKQNEYGKEIAFSNHFIIAEKEALNARMYLCT